MSIYLGSSKISKVYIGGNEVSAVYKGTTKIRPDIIPVTGITLNKSSISFIAKNQTNQLTATVSPATATNKNVTWASSNTNIATVNSNGLVTCKDAGTCNITVTTQDGGYTATCGVTATLTTTDYSYTSYKSRSDTYGRYYIKITALKSGKIKSFGFVNNGYSHTGTLWVKSGDDPTPVGGTTYSVSGVTSEYTLSTPYQITAGSVYTLAYEPNISGKWANRGINEEANGISSLPQTRTAVRFDARGYADSSSYVEMSNDAVIFFRYLVIDYT